MKSVLALMFVCAIAQANPHLEETRYCGVPVRDATGAIVRSVATINAFRAIHPCPVTGKTTGACHGWAINHTIPLACGGCDAVSNMDWMPVEIKSCSQPWCRDRWERSVYANTPKIDGTPACTNVIVTWK